MRNPSKKIGIIITVIVVTFALCISVVLVRTSFWSIPSPNGQYEAFGWTIDKGGWGYTGKILYKECGIFESWHDTGAQPPAIIDTNLKLKHR